MRKLLGYRLKEECEWLRSAIEVISDYNYEEDKDGKVFILEDSKVHKHILEAGVMHWFEEVYEEENLEVGEWYWSSMGGIWFVESGDEYEQKSYGLNLDGEWCESCTRNSVGLTPATTEEIESALIKEAKKRGFKEGVRFNNSKLYKHTPGSTNTIIGDFKYEDGHLSVKGYGGYYGRHTIFKDGKWAEILPTETLNGKTAIIDGVEYELKIK